MIRVAWRLAGGGGRKGNGFLERLFVLQSETSNEKVE